MAFDISTPERTLTTMGQGWFILHMYAKYIDPNERREYKCTPNGYKYRIGAFAHYDNEHRMKTINDSINYQGVNCLDTSAAEIREMARKLKEYFEI